MKLCNLRIVWTIVIGIVVTGQASPGHRFGNAARAQETGQITSTQAAERSTLDAESPVPDWVADAVFYQIFPERFRNGDPTNDPTRESLEHPDAVPATWEPTRWTAGWYDRAAWERQLGNDFYRNGVFDRRYGGDLQGILDSLGYLADLGVNAIYLNPVFYARSLHKYDGICFHHIDPYFGPDPAGDLKLISEETDDPSSWHWTAADKLFLRLLQEMHDRNMHLIIDGVFNHTGVDFFAFRSIRERQSASPFVGWYTIESYDDPRTHEDEFRYRCWWGVKSLPEFADTPDGLDLQPGPKKYIFDVTSRWMDPDGNGDPSDGVDGWRLDVANEIPDGFWIDWHRLVRGINRQAYTLAENWADASGQIQRCGFSATMNYFAFAFLTKGYLIDGSLSPSEFATTIQDRRDAYPPEVRLALFNLIDSHDTERVASMIVNAEADEYIAPDRFDYDVGERASPRSNPKYSIAKPDSGHLAIQRLVAMFQFAFPGVPSIYYGTESGMWGADDPDDRKPMIWENLDYDDESVGNIGTELIPTPVRFNRELFDYYRELTALRHKHPALRRGEFKVLATQDRQQLLVFKRQYEKDVLIVALNRSPDAIDFRFDSQQHQLPSQWRIALASTAGSAELKSENQLTVLHLAPRTGVVLEATAE